MSDAEKRRAEAMARAKKLEAEARELTDKASELRSESAQIVAEAWGCPIGTVVMTRRGKVRVSKVGCYGFGRPMIEGYRSKKNGDWYSYSQWIGSGWEPIDESDA